MVSQPPCEAERTLPKSDSNVMTESWARVGGDHLATESNRLSPPPCLLCLRDLLHLLMLSLFSLAYPHYRSSTSYRYTSSHTMSTDPRRYEARVNTAEFLDANGQYTPDPPKSLPLNDERQKIVDTVIRMYSGQMKQLFQDMAEAYHKEAVYDDIMSFADTRWVALPVFSVRRVRVPAFTWVSPLSHHHPTLTLDRQSAPRTSRTDAR